MQKDFPERPIIFTLRKVNFIIKLYNNNFIYP